MRKSLPVLSALTVLFLGSCSPTKKTLRANRSGRYRTEQTLAAEQTARSNETGRSQAATSVDSELQSDEEEVTTTRTYDTSKPVLDATGLPPLQSETTAIRRKREQARQTVNTQEASERSTGAELNARAVGSTESRGEVSTEVQANEKRGLSRIQKTLCGLGGLFLLRLLWKLLKKRIK